MMKNRPIKIMWYGSEVDSEGKPIIPKISPSFEKRLEGLNEGEMYIHNEDSHPAIYIRTNKDRVVAIAGDVDLDYLSNVFIRKDRDDSTNFLLTLFAGAVFGKQGFASGLTGFGAKIFDNGHGEFESMFIRRFLEVPLLVYNRVDVKLGDKWRAPGAGIIKEVDKDTKTVTLKLEDGEIGAVAVGDICMGIYHSMNKSDNATEDYDDSKGNRKFAGFCTVYFTITEVMGDRNEQFRYQLRPVSSSWSHSFDPFEMMTFIAYGSFTNEQRQTSVYETRTYTRMLWKQNTWEIGAANIALQYGELDNLNVHGMNMKGYSMYLNNVYFTGTIKQVKPDGSPVMVVNFVGVWSAGKYDYYDSVTHKGSTWVCINEDGTAEEPGKGNDWLCTAAKGSDGKDGPQGVPGIKGEDGKTLWTWIRYADNENGGGISNDPTGKEYIGFAYNKSTATESNNPSDYTWSLIKGTDGVQGPAGADGKPTYTWIAYSDNADGSGMYQVPTANTKYIGIAVNKSTATESNNPSDYTWSKFKGEDGISVTYLGEWVLGMTVPKLGIVTMNGNSYIAKVATNNPPLWVWTDHSGNLLTYHDGTYATTGEMNTAEYDLMVQSGKDGADGRDYEWIFTHTTKNVKPARPSTQQKDDYVPAGWNDDATGVSATVPYEWASKRTKKDGVWSEFSDPALWANYSFDAVSADLDNEMDNVALDENGKVYADTTITTTASMWNGQEKVALSSISVKNVTGISVVSNLATGVITMSMKRGVAIADRTEIEITLKAKVEGVEQERVIRFTLAGVRGGKNAVLYSVVTSESSIVKKKDGTYSVSGVSATRYKTIGGTSEVTTEGSLKYAIDGGAEVTTNNGTAVQASSIKTKIVFSFYDGNGMLVDKETVPLIQDGKDGQGYTQMGAWKLGMTVPKMGVVSMNGGSYVAKVATNNPPLWVWTDHSGNLLTYHDGTYATTGEMNTAEYDVWAERGSDGKDGKDGSDGKDGKDGKDGEKGDKGEQGIQGCIVRDSEWASGVEYRNDEALKSGTRYIDVVLVRNNSTATGYDAYKCIKTHTSSSSITYKNKAYWEEFGVNTTAIFTSLIIAKNAKLNFVQGNQLLIQKDDGTVTAGLSGSISGSKIRIWAGSASPDTAPFRVDEAGNMVASKANITGTITATSGRIGGFDISSSRLEAIDGGNGMLLSANLIRFTGEYSSVYIGAETMPATGGGAFSTPIRIAVNRTISSMLYGNAGLHISVEGSHAYDDNNYQHTGNHAIYIPKGDLCGFRLRSRRVSTSVTLSVMDSVIFAITKDIVITLPSTAEGGQFYWIRNVSDGNIKIKGTGLAGWADGTVSTEMTLTKNRVTAIFYDAVNKRWFMNWIDCWN